MSEACMDKMSKDLHFNLTQGERSVDLIVNIFLQALKDACAYKKPRSFEMLNNYKIKRIKKDGGKLTHRLRLERRSFNARQFLNKGHPSFMAYCNILDIDPESLEKECWKIINKKDNEL